MKINRHGQAEILSKEQCESLFTHGLLSARDKALFGVCLYTAARIREACTLLKEDCFLEDSPREKLILRKSNTKGKKVSREIPVHPKLRELLGEYQATHPNWRYSVYVFPGKGGFQHLHPCYPHSVLKGACRRVGLVGVSTHSFRRTCLTNMSSAGVPLRHIQSISGHTSLQALQRYLGVTEEDKVNAINSLNL